MVQRIVGRCRDDNCSRLIVDDESGQVYVQGVVVDRAGTVAPGPGEGLVRISRGEFEELIELYARDS